jgi:hypothetical protein|nr:MAG TPA: hypothetical protein [Bacteriophage sp.]
MTDKEKYAIKIAIDTMNKHFSRHCNVVYGNRETGVSVWYGEAINILSDMLSNTDNHTCNCKHNGNSRDSEPCCRCDSKVSENDDTKNKVTSLEIIVRMIDNNPYYEIKYKKVGEDYYQVGYSSFNIDNVLKWRDECFELVYVKATNADKIRNMPDEELAEFLDIVGEDGISSQYADVPCDCCCEKTECSKCWKDWLQSEAE